MNAELIRSSLEMKHYRICALVYGGGLALFFAVTAALASAFRVYEVYAYAVILAAVLLPFTAYYVYKMLTLGRDADAYELYTAALDEAHHTWNRKMYLILRVEKPNGADFRVTTEGIFSRSVLSDLYYGEFYRRKINILYNKYTDRVVVLGHDGETDGEI